MIAELLLEVDRLRKSAAAVPGGERGLWKTQMLLLKRRLARLMSA